MDNVGFVGFIIIGIAAFLTLLQSWFAHGKPRYGALWLVYAATPATVIILIGVIPASWLWRQGLIDVLWAGAYTCLSLGFARFLGIRPRRQFFVLLFALAFLSGLAYLLAPDSTVASISGATVFLSGTIMALSIARGGFSPELRGARITLWVGLVILLVRMTAQGVTSLSSADAFATAQLISGTALFAFLYYHAYSLAGLIQQSQFRTLVETTRALEEAAYQRRMGNLVASLAHEFGTPVFALRSLIPGLRSRFRSGDYDEHEFDLALEHAENAVSQLAGVAEQYRMLLEDDAASERSLFDLETLLGELRMLVLPEGAAPLRWSSSRRVMVHGPHRRTVRLLALIVQYMQDLHVHHPGASLEVSLATPRKGAPDEGVNLRVDGIPVPAAELRAHIHGDDPARIAGVASARALAYAVDQLRRIYEVDGALEETRDGGSRIRAHLPGHLAAIHPEGNESDTAAQSAERL